MRKRARQARGTPASTEWARSSKRKLQTTEAEGKKGGKLEKITGGERRAGGKSRRSSTGLPVHESRTGAKPSRKGKFEMSAFPVTRKEALQKPSGTCVNYSRKEKMEAGQFPNPCE